MRKLLVIAFCLITAYQLKAEESPFDFLRYISGARASAMGGAFVSMDNDASAIFYNPATTYTVEDKKINATFLKHVLDINSGNISYIYDLPEYGKIAGYIGYQNYGSFDYADAQGNLNGTFTANDFAIGATYSDELDENFYYGVGIKYIYVNLEEVSASAVAVDAGLFYRIPEKRLNFGLSILHAGSQITKIDGANDNIPLDIRLGFNHKLKGLPFLFSFNFHHLGDSDYDGFFERFKSFTVGGELLIGEYLRARVGFDNEMRANTASELDRGLTGISAGVGIVTEKFNINYGLSMYGSSTSVHRFSVNFDI